MFKLGKGTRPKWGGTSVTIIAMTPAYNEADFIGATVNALKAQTIPPDRIIVIANNCTDNTAMIAKEHGAEVIDLPVCEGRKAGALNTALEQILPTLDDDDYVFVQDADTLLVPDFFRLAFECMAADPKVVICGRYAAHYSRNPLIILQRNEFARDGRMTTRRFEKTHILVGTSSMFPVYILRAVVQAREQGRIPGHGYVYDPESVTEDFRLTLDLKTIGYRTMSPNGAEAITAAMPTLPMLWKQRIRWMRGGIEDLRLYGHTKVTRGFHLRRAYIMFGFVSFLLFVATFTASVLMQRTLQISMPWVILTSIFVVARVVEVRKAGRLNMIIAAMLLPEIFYNIFHQAVFITAWFKSLGQKPAAWHET